MIQFFVPGIPAPGGSKKYVGHSKAGKAILTDAGGAKTRNWRDAVACEARRAMGSSPLYSEPVEVWMTFFMPRPKGHYGSGRNSDILKPSSPKYPTTKPDALKLARSTEDAMTGIVWTDDSISVDLNIRKRYARKTGATGVKIVIHAMDN